MKNITKITIPQPCHQQWDNMTDAKGGRHCNSCAKTVIDFTFMSNQQIIDYLSNASNVCGRISAHQFDSVNHQLRRANLPKAGLWKRAMLAISMLTTLTYAKAQSAPNQPATEQGPTIMLGKVINPNDIGSYLITGKVLTAMGKPLVGVTVSAGNNGVITDSTGAFTIKVTKNIKKLRIAFAGWETKEIAVNKNQTKPVKVVLNESLMMLGGLGAIKKQSKFKMVFNAYVWQPVKTLIG